MPERRGEGQERGVSTFTVTGSRLKPHYEETRNKLNTELLFSVEAKQGSSEQLQDCRMEPSGQLSQRLQHPPRVPHA